MAAVYIAEPDIAEQLKRMLNIERVPHDPGVERHSEVQYRCFVCGLMTLGMSQRHPNSVRWQRNTAD
jgi:hypothetical protein